jgi:hypothetical protein
MAASATALSLTSLALAGDAASDAKEKDECASAAERAQSDRQAGHLRAAHDELLRCARASCPATVRVDCAEWLDQVTAAQPTVVLRARGPARDDLVDVSVDIDGQRAATRLDGTAMPLDPGEHVLRFSAPGLPPVQMKVLVAEGDKARSIVAELGGSRAAAEPEATPAPRKTASPSVLPWIGFGAAAAGFGAFAALEIVAHSELSTLQGSCGLTHACKESQVSPVRTKFDLAGVALGVGLTGAAVGVLSLVLRSKDDGAQRAFLGVGPTADGAALRVGGSF